MRGLVCVASAISVLYVLSCKRALEIPTRLSAQEQSDRRKSLWNASSLYCENPTGTTAWWNNDLSVHFEKPQRAFAGNERMAFVAIDLKKGTAEMVGNQGTSTLRAVRTQMGLLFIEETPTGSENFTVVFSDAPAGIDDREFLYSHSRNIIGFGGATVSQYLGTCTVTEKSP